MYRADGANLNLYTNGRGYEACLDSLAELLVECNRNGGLLQSGRRLDIVFYPGKRPRWKRRQ